MKKKRVRSWKDLCEQHMKRIIAIIKEEPDPGVPISREDRKLLERGLTPEALLLAQQSNFELNAGLEGEQKNVDITFTRESEEDKESEANNEADDLLTTQNLMDLDNSSKGQVSDMMAYWNTSAIVGRLHKPTRVVDGKGVLPMLGPNSYFEESYAETVRKNVREEDVRLAELEAAREKLRLNSELAEEESRRKLAESNGATSLNSLAGQDKGSVYYVPEGKEIQHALRPEVLKRTIKERKEFFYKLINKKSSTVYDDDAEVESL